MQGPTDLLWLKKKRDFSNVRHGICQKFYTAGISGQNFYTIDFT